MNNIEILKFKSELIYKKLIVLLAISGGSGAYTVRFYEHQMYGITIFFVSTFLVSALGIGINFQEINKIKKRVEEI